MGKTTSRAMLAVLALAAAGVPLYAAEPAQSGQSSRFQRADSDKSGDLTFGEFAASSDRQVSGADANGDGKMTAEEIADEMMRARARRMAQRIVKQFDADGDGAVTPAEIEGRQKARFARLDKNGDGKLTAEEMPKARQRQPKK